jgi:predicted RND superfamily exporter protein
VCLLVLVLVTLALFRDILTAIAVLAAPFISLLILLAGLQALRIPLLPIAQLVPPLMLGLGASYAVFIACRYLDAHASGDMRRTRGVAGSTVLACVTTIAGFASLIPLDTRAVAQFGLCGNLFLLPQLVSKNLKRRETTAR